MPTVTLNASARYGYGGKQYIARITGRDSKFTFAREFVGRKEGKRRQCATYTTDEPGLYLTCDLDSKGRKDETYWIVLPTTDGGLGREAVALDDAMCLAKLLDEGKSIVEADRIVFPPPTPEQLLRSQIREHEEKLAVSIAKNAPDEMVVLEAAIGNWAKGASVRRGDLITHRQQVLASLQKDLESLLNPPAPPSDLTIVTEHHLDAAGLAPHNPLADFTDEQIRIEFIRRGLAV